MKLLDVMHTMSGTCSRKKQDKKQIGIMKVEKPVYRILKKNYPCPKKSLILGYSTATQNNFGKLFMRL